MKDSAHTGTSKVVPQAINIGRIRKFLPNYASFHVPIQSHGHSAGVRPHYATANEIKYELHPSLTV